MPLQENHTQVRRLSVEVLLACALPLQELQKQCGKTGRIGHFVPVVNMEESGKIAVDGEDLKILV